MIDLPNIISITDLPHIEFSVEDVKAHLHYWEDNTTWESPKSGRIDHALMLFIDCNNTYEINKTNRIKAYKNDIAYLPKDVIYTCHFDNNSQSSNNIITKKSYTNYYYDGNKKVSIAPTYNAIYIGFNLYDKNHLPFKLSEEIKVFSLSNIKKVKSRFEELVFQAKTGNVSPLKMNISLYKLLLEISNTIQYDTSNQRNSMIYPALKYIAENDLSEITITKLAEVCDISVSGFREKFKSEMNITPINYIAELKIQKADEMLKKSNIPISTIAYNLGFSDVGYFSRFYKKHTGYPPSKRF